MRARMHVCNRTGKGPCVHVDKEVRVYLWPRRAAELVHSESARERQMLSSMPQVLLYQEAMQRPVYYPVARHRRALFIHHRCEGGLTHMESSASFVVLVLPVLFSSRPSFGI